MADSFWDRAFLKILVKYNSCWEQSKMELRVHLRGAFHPQEMMNIQKHKALLPAFQEDKQF